MWRLFSVLDSLTSSAWQCAHNGQFVYRTTFLWLAFQSQINQQQNYCQKEELFSRDFKPLNFKLFNFRLFQQIVMHTHIGTNIVCVIHALLKLFIQTVLYKQIWFFYCLYHLACPCLHVLDRLCIYCQWICTLFERYIDMLVGGDKFSESLNHSSNDSFKIRIYSGKKYVTHYIIENSTWKVQYFQSHKLHSYMHTSLK